MQLREIKDRRESGVTFLMLWQCSADKQCQGHVDIYSGSPAFHFQIHACQVDLEAEEGVVVPDPWITTVMVNS